MAKHAASRAQRFDVVRLAKLQTPASVLLPVANQRHRRKRDGRMNHSAVSKRDEEGTSVL